MLNYSFNISLKVYSVFLLVLSVMIMLPDRNRLYSFFIQNDFVSKPNMWQPVFVRQKNKWYYLIKYFVVGIIIMECLFPYIKSGNFNDDKALRPYLHGAYLVKELYSPTSLSMFPQDRTIKKVFVHRQGYLIFQDEKDEVWDFRMTYVPESDFIYIEDGTNTDIQYLKYAYEKKRQYAKSSSVFNKKQREYIILCVCKALRFTKNGFASKRF